MPLTLDEHLRVGQAKKRDVDHWHEGIRLEAKSGRKIQALTIGALRARVALADNFWKEGKVLSAQNGTQRSAISRYYYCSYHIFRAVVGWAHGGDDFQEHTELPKHFPPDFPEKDKWANWLKNLRETRNQADYNTHPKSIKYWQQEMVRIKVECAEARKTCKTYLRGKRVLP